MTPPVSITMAEDERNICAKGAETAPPSCARIVRKNDHRCTTHVETKLAIHKFN
jgi:hypothetical protein